MLGRLFVKMNLVLFAATAIVACTSSDDGTGGGPMATKARQDYQAAVDSLEHNGAVFSTESRDETITIRLSFDKLNAKIKAARSNQEKADYLEAMANSIKDFQEKALLLMNTNSLEINEYNTIAKKRKMLTERSVNINAMMATYKGRLTKERKEAALKAAKPYTVKLSSRYGTSEFPLCGDSDVYNTLIRNNRSQLLHELRLLNAVVCSSAELREKASELFSQYQGARPTQYQTGFYVELKENSSADDKLLPKDIDSLKNQLITDYRKYDDRERLKNAPIIINLPIFELLYLVQENRQETISLALFLEHYLLNDNEPSVLLDFERLYEQKDAILSKFNDSRIKDFLERKFKKAFTKTTDEIIGFILSKDYQKLETFASAENSNKISYNRSLTVKSSLTAYGLSPLMVAAVLNDEQAIEILLNVKDIDPNLESPIFKSTYTTIKSYSISTLGRLQTYGGVSGAGSSGFGGSAGGSGSGGSGGSSGNALSYRKAQRYKGFTALMIAVAENQCDVVDLLIETEPHTVNHRTSRGQTALGLSLYYENNCIKNLLKAGAFDINQFYNGRVSDKPTGDINDFIKDVKPETWESPSVKERMPKILLFRSYSLEFKKALLAKVPVSVSYAKTAIKDRVEFQRGRSSNFSGSSLSSYVTVAYDFDLKFINFLKIDLSKEKLFKAKNSNNTEETLLSYIFGNLHNRYMKKEQAETAFSKALQPLLDVNPKWVTDWANGTDSFKGQNPMVAASMFNEVGLLSALISVDGVDVNTVDSKTGYNALEWQYSVNPFFWLFTASGVANDLKDKGAKVRVPVNLVKTPNSDVREDMASKWKSTEYPFHNKSRSTKLPKED